MRKGTLVALDVSVLSREGTDGETVVGGVLQVLDEHVELFGAHDGVKQQIAGALNVGPGSRTAAYLVLDGHLDLIAGTVVDTVPIEVDGVTMGVGTIQTTVVGVVTTLTAVVVIDEHGHELSVRPFCGAVAVFLTGGEEAGDRSQETVEYTCHQNPRPFLIIYLGNHNSYFLILNS